jgi:uncharacterized protein YggE
VQDDRMVVQGSARRSVAPDVATLRMLVMELDADQRAAFERCGPRMNEVVARLRALVGGDGQVTTGTLRVERYWDECSDEEHGPRVQAASAPIAVECTPALAAPVVSAAMALGLDEVHGPRYSLRDPSPILEELLGAAVAAARRKAERLAQAAERSLGAIVAVEERSRDGWDDDGVREAAAAAAPAEVDLRPAELTLAATVRVTFALR